MRRSIGTPTRRAGALVALLALVAALVATTPGSASASTGGTATATGADLTVLEVTAGSTVLIPGFTATEAQASAPATNGTNTDTVSVGFGPITLTTLTGSVLRTPGALASTAQIADFSLSLAGTEVVGADLVSSISYCPIDGGGSPSSQADLLNLTIGGASASVGDTDVVVSLGDLGFPLVVNSAGVRVTVTQQQAADATSASATGLIVSIDLFVDLIGLPPIDVHIIDLALAATDCTRPTGQSPVATSISPGQGPELTAVTITGEEFVPGYTSIDVGGTTILPGDTTVSLDGTTVGFEVPSGSPLGPTAVTATTPVGTTGPLGFLVTAGVAPTALGISPEQGPVGTTVTITGSGFVPTATSVDLGAITVPTTDVAVAADGTSLTFDVPVGAPLGATTVAATTPDGTTGPLGFLVTAAVAPTVSGIDPGEGPVGTTVTVTGSDFVPGATTVEFGDLVVPVTDVEVNGAGTELTFTVPDGAPDGPTTVVVRTPAGPSAPQTFTVTSTGGGGGSGGTPATPVATGGTLPYTGSDGTAPIVGLGLLLLAAGAALALSPGLRGMRFVPARSDARAHGIAVPASWSGDVDGRSGRRVVTAGTPRWMAAAIRYRAAHGAGRP